MGGERVTNHQYFRDMMKKRNHRNFMILSSDEDEELKVVYEKSGISKENSAKREVTSEKIHKENYHDLYYVSRKKSIRKRSYSSSSSNSCCHSHYKRRKHSQYAVRIMDEAKVPEYLFGRYNCSASKGLNIVNTAVGSVPIAEVERKTPKNGPVIERRIIKDPSFIQNLVDDIKNPCPGLHHVSEVRSFTETSYFCSMCEAPCSGNSILPHLRGFNHMLNSLKHYDRELYEKLKDKRKNKIEKIARNALRQIVRIKGTGQITVQEEFLSVKGTQDEHVSGSSSVRRGQKVIKPHLSYQDHCDFKHFFDSTTIPDTSAGGYYCQLCDADMNCIEMWDNHITGKRHTTNARKLPGSLPSKIKHIPMKGIHPNLMNLIKDVDAPVVGLNHIQEFQNPNTHINKYQCMICSKHLTSSEIIEHLLTQKHRVQLLKKIKHECLYVLKEMNINGRDAFALVEQECAILEARHGSGKPAVFYSRDFFQTVF